MKLLTKNYVSISWEICIKEKLIIWLSDVDKGIITYDKVRARYRCHKLSVNCHALSLSCKPLSTFTPAEAMASDTMSPNSLTATLYSPIIDVNEGVNKNVNGKGWVGVEEGLVWNHASNPNVIPPPPKKKKKKKKKNVTLSLGQDTHRGIKSTSVTHSSARSRKKIEQWGEERVQTTFGFHLLVVNNLSCCISSMRLFTQLHLDKFIRHLMHLWHPYIGNYINMSRFIFSSLQRRHF